MEGEATLFRLLRHAGGHHRQVAAAVLCSVLNKLWDLAPPVLIGAAVDVVVQREDSALARLGVSDPTDQLTLLAVVTVVVWALESAFEYAYTWLWRNLAQQIQHEFRVEAYGHIQRLGTQWHTSRAQGDVMAVLNDDVNQLERFLDGGANSLLQVATTVIVVGAAFLAASAKVAIWAIAPIPLVVLGSFWFQGRIAPRYTAVREKVGLLNAVLANNLQGINTIKSYTAEDREQARVAAASEAYRQTNRKAIALSAAFSPLIRMVIVVGFTATLLVGGWMALDGVMEVGLYSVLVFMPQRLLWPLTRLGQTFDLYQRAMASTRRVLDLLATPAPNLHCGVHLDGASARGDVAFENVQFGYDDHGLLFDDLNLHIPAGTSLAVVGPTGAGKSSLLALLLRFRDPRAGRVSIGGHDLQQLSLATIRQHIATVSQHPFLFPGTVRENIAYGRPDADLGAIEQAAKVAEAYGFIEQLPQGFDTVLGERGQTLSGGQAQRIALARAVLKDAPILLLDEATSAVDNETEAAIQRSIDRLSHGRTTVMVAHRLSTIRHAHRIVVMDHGRIAESGTHDSLVALGGMYARMWQIQTGERQTVGVAHEG